MTPGIDRRLWRRVLLATAGFAAIAGLIALFVAGLGRDPSLIPSPLITKSVPQFDLPRLGAPGRLRLADYRGKRIVINFWASWCVVCREEHETLIALGQRLAHDPDIVVLGVDYRDAPQAAHRYLTTEGKFPYPSAVDADGRVGIDFGVYGLPETYFVDARGIVVAKQIGALDAATAERYLKAIGESL